MSASGCCRGTGRHPPQPAGMLLSGPFSPDLSASATPITKWCSSAILWYTDERVDNAILTGMVNDRLVDFDEIDLVVLNQASPILRFEAVSGLPVYTSDMEARATFVSLTAREYEDEMAQWRRALTA